MAKHFLKIEANTAAKNKLQTAIKDEIKKLDQTLFPSHDKAKEAVYAAFDKAMNSYTGKCTEPRPGGDYTSSDDSRYTIWVSSMMVVTIFRVKADLT